MDGFKRIAAHKDQIGAFSRFDGADFLIEAHQPRRHNRGGLIASIGVNPAWAYSSISRCRLWHGTDWSGPATIGTPALCSAPAMATNFANLLSWRSATGEGGPTSARIAASSGTILAIPGSKVTGGFDLVNVELIQLKFAFQDGR